MLRTGAAVFLAAAPFLVLGYQVDWGSRLFETTRLHLRSVEISGDGTMLRIGPNPQTDDFFLPGAAAAIGITSRGEIAAAELVANTDQPPAQDPFHQLRQDEILQIVDIFVSRIEAQLKNKDMGLELTETAKKYLANKGFDPVLGARPLRRTIQRELEDTLSEQILFNELRPGQIVVVDCEGDPANVERSKLTFTGADRGTTVPDAVPADLGAGATGGTPATEE